MKNISGFCEVAAVRQMSSLLDVPGQEQMMRYLISLHQYSDMLK